MTDLPERLDIKAGVMEMGEKIAWGSDTALMREAAKKIRDLQSENTRLKAELMNKVENQLSQKVIDRIFQYGRDRYGKLTDRISKKWDEIGRPTCDIADYVPNEVEGYLEEAAYHLRNGYFDAAERALKRAGA